MTSLAGLGEVVSVGTNVEVDGRNIPAAEIDAFLARFQH